MVFTKRLREGIRRGRIRCTIRIWTRLQVKVGGRYVMDDGHVVVDSIEPIEIADITDDLSRESGFDGVDDLLETARHGRGDQAYLIRFHYLPPGAWDGPRWTRGAKTPPGGPGGSGRSGGSGRPGGSGGSGGSGRPGGSGGSGRSGRSKTGC